MDQIAQVFHDPELLIQRQHPVVAWTLARYSDWREILVARLVVAAVEPAGVERVQRRTLSGTFGCRLLLDRASLAHRTLGLY